MNLPEFKLFVVQLIKSIIQLGDSKAQSYQVQLQELSEKNAELAATIEKLSAALGEAEASKATALMEAAQEQAASLSELSSQLSGEFNPTPVADAVAAAVEAAPEVVTPDVVESSDTIDEPEPTPVAVSDAAVEAIAEAAE